MSSNSADRKLRTPSPDLATIKVPRTRQPARNWFRVHRSIHAANHFSLDAHHRYSHPECPYHYLYVGVDTGTCCFERFGDNAYDTMKAIPKTLWDDHGISLVRVPELHVCDMTDAKTLSALMVDLSALMDTHVATPQEWGLAIQNHPASFQGIKFKSRFNGKACLALFKRDGIEVQVKDTPIASLCNDDTSMDWLDKRKISLY